MRDLTRTIAHIERTMTRNLDAPQPQRRAHRNRSRKRTQYVWRAGRGAWGPVAAM